MSKRRLFVILGLVSLLGGGSIYAVFRKNSYIAHFLDCGPIRWLQTAAEPFSNDFIRFYLSDFLWGFGLCCFLLCLFNSNTKGAVLCAAASFVCGAIWEILQFASVVGGTGDWLDVIMYFAATAGVATLYLLRRD